MIESPSFGTAQGIGATFLSRMAFGFLLGTTIRSGLVFSGAWWIILPFVR